MRRARNPAGTPPFPATRQDSPRGRRRPAAGVAQILTLLALLCLGGLYWSAVCRLAAVDEPWDVPAYGHAWYPLSIALAAGVGLPLGKRGWMAGLAITASQLPVMLANSGTGPLIAVGVLFLCVLSVPAAAASWLAGVLRIRRDRA